MNVLWADRFTTSSVYMYIYTSIHDIYIRWGGSRWHFSKHFQIPNKVSKEIVIRNRLNLSLVVRPLRINPRPLTRSEPPYHGGSTPALPPRTRISGPLQFLIPLSWPRTLDSWKSLEREGVVAPSWGCIGVVWDEGDGYWSIFRPCKCIVLSLTLFFT